MLTAEQFAQILETLRSDTVCGRASEHRIVPRVGLRARTVITCLRAGGKTAQQKVWIRDLSVGGIGLVTSEPLEPGSHFACMFRGCDTRTTVLYEVVRCREAAESQYNVGARFKRFARPQPDPSQGPADARAA